MHGSRRVPAVLIVGACCVVLAGILWALFAHELHTDGRSPSRVLPPFEAEGYYRAQTWFIAPALLGLWGVLSLVAHRLTGGAGRGTLVGLAGWLGVVYGLALLLAFVGPEWLVYRRDGIEGLRAGDGASVGGPDLAGGDARALEGAGRLAVPRHDGGLRGAAGPGGAGRAVPPLRPLERYSPAFVATASNTSQGTSMGVP